MNPAAVFFGYHMIDPHTAAEFEALLHKIVQGDGAAWQTLWQAAQPAIWAVTGRWQLTGPIASRTEDRRNILLKVMDRLREDDFRRIRLYLQSTRARGPSSSFRSWLTVVTARTAIDYVRAQPEYLHQRSPDHKQHWVHIVAGSELERPAAGPTPHDIAIASELLERARCELTPSQLAVLCLWLQGQDDATIASQLQLGDPNEARKLLRSGIKRLRDRYAESSGESPAALDQEVSS